MIDEMKSIQYQGRQYSVPIWVKFVATDESGSIYGYEFEPYKSKSAWLGSEGRLFLVTRDKEWDSSLAEVV